MTASPVDAKVDVTAAAEDLESLLYSRIATTRDLTLLRKTVHRADEEILRYALPPQVVPTQLYRELHARYKELDILDKMFQRAQDISDHLGSWCSDFYWKLTLREAIAAKGEAHLTRAHDHKRGAQTLGQLNQQIDLFKQALTFVESHALTFPALVSPILSNKILRLNDYLQRHFEHPSDMRCVVFVEQRHTARLLAKVFEHIGGANLHAGALVGSGATGLAEMSVSFREQIVTMMKFRTGEINCLFATSVAEEGLDVPDCNLVIRFDPCKTMIQYIQSRGRARHKHSKFVHMLETGNGSHKLMLKENRLAEQYMRQFCERLPANRYLEGNDDENDQMKGDRNIFVIEATGAKVTYANCLQILQHFVSMLPTEEEELLQPFYVVTPVMNKFVCEVILPSCSPFPGLVGAERRRKSLAKRSAAFKACVELYNRHLLDDNLIPIYKKQLPAMRNAALAIGMKKADGYDMRLKPELWTFGRGTTPERLHLLRIDLPDGLDRRHRSMILLSRQILGAFPTFPLFLASGKSSLVVTTSVTSALQVTNEDVEVLTTFTLRVFKDVFNKTYENDSSKMSYWLVPGRTGSADTAKEARDLIDWEAVFQSSRDGEYRWSPQMNSPFLVDKFLVDPFSGANRYFCERIATEYKPSDPVPPDTVKKGKFKDNILDYSVNLWRKSRQRAEWNPDQPVMQTEKVLLRRNMLAQPEPASSTSVTTAFLCPEPLKISTLDSDFVTSCLAFPAIIYRIEAYLIALEACKKFDLNVEPSLALEAVTKDSDNTDDHDQNHEKINFQEGMGRNYERLEFLGDCFLKMATSLSTFVRYPSDNEFESHVKRMLMLCNQNLCKVAKELRLYEYIRTQAFSRRTWYPEGLKLLEGKGFKMTETEMPKHQLGEKNIADVCESLIGAAFLTHHSRERWTPKSWTEAIKAVTLFVGSEDHSMMVWSDYINGYKKPAYQIAEATGSQLDLASKVEKEHAYHFKYPGLLRSAFLHPSQPFSWERVPSYQRLEFLGDSLLDLVCVTHLFYKYPDKDPGWLTEHKMAMVANKFLGALCVDIGFHRHLRHHHPILESQIRTYVTELEEAKRLSNGAVDTWTLVHDPPKCLADMVEAYIGAMFIDSNFNYAEVQRFFDEHIRKYFEDMTIYDTFANGHPITRLHHMLGDSFGCNEHRLMADEILAEDAITKKVMVGLIIHTTVICGDVSKSVKYSKMRVASAAYEELRGMAPYEFRKKFGCDCTVKNGVHDPQAGDGADLDMDV